SAMRTLFLGPLALVLAAACGPGPTPESPAGGGDGDAGAATSSADGGAGGGGGAGAGGDNLAQNRKAFMDGCAKGGEGTGPFCECAWNEMRTVVGDAKMANEGPDEKDLASSQPRVMAAC